MTSAAADSPVAPDAARLRDAVEAHADTVPPNIASALTDFYAARDYRPAWLRAGRWWRSGGPGRGVDDLLSALDEAPRYGLESGDYGGDDLARQIEDAYRGGPPQPRLHDAIEIALSATLLRYLSDLAIGRIGPETLGAAWHMDRADPDLTPWLEIAAAGNVAEAVRSAQPNHAPYRALLESLAHYRRIAAEGAWPTEISAPADGETRRALRQRLEIEGYREGDLEQAIRAFQRSHGIAEDGVVGEKTLAELDVPVEERVAQIAINLERWRWMPRELSRPRVEVNVPAFHLDLRDANDRLALDMRVVVGTEARERRGTEADEEEQDNDWTTPVFSDQIETIVFNPYWNVPQSIAADEIVPALIEDSSELEKRNLEVVRGFGEEAESVDPDEIDWEDLLDEESGLRLRQRPGPDNALGRIKFLLPNRMNIYLHDTPQRSSFEETDRDLSHGCIRVEEPVALAQHLLGDEWTEESIEDAIGSDDRVEVPLPRPIAVYIWYWTAIAEASGRATFHQDLYGLDAAMQRALAQRARSLRPVAILR